MYLDYFPKLSLIGERNLQDILKWNLSNSGKVLFHNQVLLNVSYIRLYISECVVHKCVSHEPFQSFFKHRISEIKISDRLWKQRAKIHTPWKYPITNRLLNFPLLNQDLQLLYTITFWEKLRMCSTGKPFCKHCRCKGRQACLDAATPLSLSQGMSRSALALRGN